MRDANAAERAAFAKELARYRAEADGAAWADVRAAFASLGGSWQPASRAALLGLLTPKASAGVTKGRSGQGRRKS